jgi:zinc protease
MDAPAPALLPSGVRLMESAVLQPGQISINYQKYQLDNGLTLILHPSHDAPLVHIDVTYHVGSAREEPGKSGFAHFFEHMMFQGSKHVVDQQHFKIINQVGGTMNGSTSRDRTNYYETVPANELEKVLWLESDRMGFLLDAVSQKKFEIQRATVKNERAERVDNVPYGRLSERVDEARYPPNHPYSWQPIGYVEDLDRVNVDDLKAFFLRWYGPNNATLTIGGDLDVPQTLAWVARYFGPIPRGPEVAPMTAPPVRLDASRYITLEDNVQMPLLYLSYPTVKLGHTDEAALDMFAEILGGSRSSLLYQRLVETGLAVRAGASHSCDELACNLVVYVMGRSDPSVSLSQLEDEIDQAIAGFSERGVTTADVERVRSSSRASAIYGLESISDKVSQLSFGEVFMGDPLYALKLLGRFDLVDNQGVQRAVETYILNQPRVVASVVPKGQLARAAAEQNYVAAPRIAVAPSSPAPSYSSLSSLTPKPMVDDIDRTYVPPSGAPVLVHLPTLYQRTLANGLTLMGTAEQQTPTVTLLFNLPGGVLSEPQGQWGIAKLTARILGQSTQQRSVGELSDTLAGLGSYIHFSAGLYGQTIEVRTLTENLPQTLDLLREQLLTPAFRPDEFDREKARYQQGVKNKFNQSSWLADMAFQRQLYGEHSRLGISSYGTQASVASLTLEQVKAYWQRHYQPAGAQLVAVSNLSAEALTQSLASLDAWQGQATDWPHLKPSEAARPGRIYFIDKPGSVQSALRVGRPALPYDVDGNYFKASLMNFNLGGNFNSRINQVLREENGFTYGASSGFEGDREAGHFVVSTDVRADVTADALEIILDQLGEYQHSGPDAQELTYMRSAVMQQGALSYATPSQKSDYLLTMMTYQLTPQFVAKQNQIVAQIDQAVLAHLADDWLDPLKMLVVVVGDRNTVMPQLDLLGWPVEVISL